LAADRGASSAPSCPALHAFDDPIQNVRVEWLADLSGEGARLRIGPSSGTPSP
jgi:hypothetical protein